MGFSARWLFLLAALITMSACSSGDVTQEAPSNLDSSLVSDEEPEISYGSDEPDYGRLSCADEGFQSVMVGQATQLMAEMLAVSEAFTCRFGSCMKVDRPTYFAVDHFLEVFYDEPSGFVACWGIARSARQAAPFGYTVRWDDRSAGTVLINIEKPLDFQKEYGVPPPSVPPPAVAEMALPEEGKPLSP